MSKQIWAQYWSEETGNAVRVEIFVARGSGEVTIASAGDLILAIDYYHAKRLAAALQAICDELEEE